MLRGRKWPRRRINRVPAGAGVYVRYNRTKKVAAGRTFNLRRALEERARRGPAFTAFDWFLVRREEDRAALAAELSPASDGRG
jgi:hypothetical protein